MSTGMIQCIKCHHNYEMLLDLRGNIHMHDLNVHMARES